MHKLLTSKQPVAIAVFYLFLCDDDAFVLSNNVFECCLVHVSVSVKIGKTVAFDAVDSP